MLEELVWVVMFFILVDFECDILVWLKEYVEFFYLNIVGMIGIFENFVDIGKCYGVFYVW